jgi:2-polyprenyl-6-methoxyphenol hydroxylase-like FAD-dependent oxidoreductase
VDKVHGHHREHRPNATLLGGAVYAMLPFAREGANLAILNGLELVVQHLRLTQDIGAEVDETKMVR